MRDSPLTNHGFQQATRLGQFLNIRGVDLTHIFASPLQRAYTTAEQILKGQSGPNRDGLTVIPMPSLPEQDFGLLEGCSYQEFRRSDSRASTVESLPLTTTSVCGVELNGIGSVEPAEKVASGG